MEKDNLSQLVQNITREFGVVISENNKELIAEVREETQKLRVSIEQLTKNMNSILDAHNADSKEFIKEAKELNKETADMLDSHMRALGKIQNDSITTFASEVSRLSSEICNIPSSNTALIKMLLDGVQDIFDRQFDKILQANHKEIEERTNGIVQELVERLHQENENIHEVLKNMVDGIVEKNAIAIANVQKDNLEQICELRTQIQSLITKQQEEKEIQVKYKEEITKQYEELVKYQKEQTRIVSEARNDQAESVALATENVMEKIRLQLEKLFEQNVEAYANTMNDYQDKFLSANAKALAEVQKDYIDIVTGAYEIVRQNGTKTDQVIESVKIILDDFGAVLSSFDSLLNDVSTQNTELFDCLEDKIGDQTDSIERLEGVGSIFKRQVGEIKDIIEEQNSQMSKMQGEIEKLFAIVKNDGEICKTVLETVKCNQEKKNEITKKDLEIMNQILKKV